MLALLWNLSAAIRGYQRFYMPTNRALDWLRTPHGLKWAVPVAIVLAPAYLYAMGVAAVIAVRPGLGWMNLLVILFSWNALKFAWLGIVSVPVILREAICIRPPKPGSGVDPGCGRSISSDRWWQWRAARRTLLP
jgi:hypothetical protein